MRLLQGFMSVLIFVLAMLPCTDSEDHTHGHGKVCAAAESVDTATHSEHGDHVELCSPFCHCSCCHTHLVFLQLEITPPAIATPVAAYGSREDQWSSHVPNALWQPPNA